jgi:dihydroxy-acid dehydratase
MAVRRILFLAASVALLPGCSHEQDAKDERIRAYIRDVTGDDLKIPGRLVVSTNDVLTDGRFAGATRGRMAGHVAPEAVRGGPIAANREGDEITFDVDARRLDVALSDEEIAKRVEEYEAPPPAYRSGVMAKYAATVSSAAIGAVTG